jgi:hypothetical protein
MPGFEPPLISRCDGLRFAEHLDIFPFEAKILLRSGQYRQPGCGVKGLLTIANHAAPEQIGPPLG